MQDIQIKIHDLKNSVDKVRNSFEDPKEELKERNQSLQIKLEMVAQNERKMQINRVG